MIDGCDRPRRLAGPRFDNGEQRGVIGTALGLGLIGSQIYSAYAQSRAASHAADTQTAAGEHAAELQYAADQQALAFAKSTWAQTQKNMAPWLQYGSGAVHTLGDLMGIKPDMSIGGSDLPDASQPGGPPVDVAGGGRTPDTPGATGVSGTATPRPGTTPPNRTGGRSVDTTYPSATLDSTMAPPQAAPSTTAPPPARQRSASQQPSMVRIRWDDGTEQTVPTDQVAHYQELGAKVVT